ncbi:mismatch repair protein MSH3 [Novymonas esmeraldas]|uniref:Mismatch repair protein MSH3 n=1 Tax=Novymonas esmeraldas TaxID=1808958 RepID=A0AAW0ESC8_9TRYP
MSKRGRQEDEVGVAHAIEVLCCRPAAKGETDGVSLTPLEQQVVALKETLAPHVVLLVACGYRVKLYGRDSRAVSRRVGIMCIPGQPFEYSSFPYTRVDLYVHRLVAMGYHVAFADQESAAVRAADGHRSGLFTREVSQLYSRGTLLPTERVITNGGGGGGGDSVKKTREDDTRDTGEAEEGDGDDGGGVDGASGPPLLSANAAAAGASELVLCFVDARRSGGDEVEEGSSGGACATAALAPLSVTLVSFVTQWRLRCDVRGALELEDITQRYDIAEVIVLTPHAPKRRHGGPGAGSAAADAGTSSACLAALAEAYATALHRGLALHFGPTSTGAEDGKVVSVAGHACAAGQTVDAAIEAYLRPYRLDQVYRLLCTRSGAGEGGRGDAAGDAELCRHLHLPGPTLRALDVFHSSVGLRGSLLGLLDRSLTPCGSRCLRRWLAAPLSDGAAIGARQDVVRYLMRGDDDGQVEDLLRECLRLGDVEAVLGKLHAERCHVTEFVRLLRMVRGVSALATQLCDGDDGGGQPPALLGQLLAAAHGQEVALLLERHAALLRTTATTPLDFFTERGRAAPETLLPHLAAREAAEAALQAELEAARSVLGAPGLEYRTIGGTPYLLDVPAGKCARAPSDWVVQTRTKTNVRYHTPVITEQHIALTAATERLAQAAAAAWRQQQRDTVADAAVMRVLAGVVEAIASLDALRSLAVVSAQPGYVMPTLVALPEPASASPPASVALSIRDGRHPVLDRLLPHGYVGCDVRLRAGGAWLLTGPNMGGKSALMRMVGCFAVLAQLGCGVPADAATLPVFDGVFSRMGASDAILDGASTFLSEMDETSRILCATQLPRSLVLMDELGRGTSSFDGAAVAAATLEYLLDRRATTFFVTHYSYLCSPYAHAPVEAGAEEEDGEASHGVACYYMGYRLVDPHPHVADGAAPPSLVFTYKPCRGVTPSSFGVAVGRRAGLPAEVTDAAGCRSAEVERQHRLRQDAHELRRFLCQR